MIPYQSGTVALHSEFRTMAPATFDHVVIPSPMFTSPKTDSRAVTPRKALHQYSMPNNDEIERKGVPNRHSRLLTADEALQYSPLSSIVPFSPGMSIELSQQTRVYMLIRADIIPTPNAHLPSSQTSFATSTEEQAARQSLNLLDKAVTEPHGRSNHAQITLKTIQPYLEQKNITKL